MVKKFELESGLRVVVVPIEKSPTATILVLAGVGSKYETKEINGISHFLEHMLFKGTEKMASYKEVAETLDKIGGSYNAFTGEEYTGYYAKVALPHFDIALEWVSDIFLNSKIPADEAAKERGVIIEEINMIKDHPMSHVQGVWTKLLYGDQPAGWDIAGTKETVLSIERDDLVDYMERGYRASNTVVCVAGSFDPEKIREKIESHFDKIRRGKEITKEAVIEHQEAPAAMNEKRETDQTHLCLGVRAYDTFHPQRRVLSVIETILGKMMSSRLFVRIREELGLAYYIRTGYDAYSDSGYLVTQAGVDNKKVIQAVGAILDEYDKISSEIVSQEELSKAKENIKGRLAISLESSDALAYYYGLQELVKKEIKSLDQIFKEIDQVKAEDILTVSKDIFKPENLNLAAIGPISESQLEKAIKR